MFTQNELNEISIVFATDYDLYRSRGTAVKVSMWLPNRGAFWILWERNANSVQRGKRYFHTNKTQMHDYNKLFAGSGRGVYYKTDLLMDNWSKFMDWQRDGIYQCIRNLASAFRLYRAGDSTEADHIPLDDSDRQVIFDKIRILMEQTTDKIEDYAIFGKPVTEEVETTATQEEITATPVAETTATTDRKTVKCAVVQDDGGLTEFVKGEFYRVDGEKTFASQTFLCLVNAYGEKRYIDANRVKMVDVFDEPVENCPMMTQDESNEISIVFP